MKMPMKVAVDTPPRTPMPIAFCAAAPAPVATASGRTPRVKAIEVIRIGRSRRRAASTVASIRLLPRFSCSAANSTIRMAFFAARPIVVRMPTLK